MKSFARQSLLPLLVIAAVSVTQAAKANETAANAPRVEIAFNDLALSTPAGRLALERRVRYAAVRVCSTGGTQPLWQSVEYRRCTRAAEEQAFTQISDVARARDVSEQTSESDSKSSKKKLVCMPRHKPAACEWM